MVNTPKAPTAAQTEFDKVLSERFYNQEAKELGTAIFKKITSVGASTKIADIHSSIAKAAGEGDDAKLEALFGELKQAKLDEKNLGQKFKEIRGTDKFETIVQAWGPEIRDLAYTIAVEVIKGTNVALQNATSGGDTGSSKSKTASGAPKKPAGPAIKFEISNEKGEKAVLVMRKGAAAPGSDEEAYKLLGFKVSADGKSVTPATFKMNDGTESPNAKRSTIRDALRAGTAFKGFTITEIK
jgi:hypothetical protein